jgi:hypothetical protein
MSDPSNDPNWWIRFAGYAIFAAFGGSIGHVLRTLDSGQPIRWGKAIAQGVGAGFVGVLVLLACQALGLSEQWTGLTVGVCGWMGASATIVILEKLVFKRLGIGESNKPTAEQE